MPREKIDLTGVRSGDLEAIECVGSGQKLGAMWRCRCHKCGGECIIPASRLTAKRPQKDCGCTKRYQCRDLSGETFGCFEVLERSNEKTKKQSVIYKCRCSKCGKIKMVSQDSLRLEHISCGCETYTPEKMRKKNAISQEKTIINGVNVPVVLTNTPRKDNLSTGVRGVRKVERATDVVYEAKCQVGGKTWYEYGFTTIDAAVAARNNAINQMLEASGIDKRK